MSATAASPDLVELAHAHGVSTEYWDWRGGLVTVSRESISAILGALGVDCSTDEAISRSLTEAADAPWHRTLPATVVAREGWTPWVHVHVPDGTGVWLTVELEDGSVRDVPAVDRWVPARVLDGAAVGEATFELPGDLPTGWHRIHAHTEVAPLTPETEVATLIITPQSLVLPECLQQGRVAGLMAQLYQVRSRESWGIGDLGDLADLAAWAAEEHGADFVLINPLHAAEPIAPMEPSPYLPTTRRFVNPVYLRVEDVPEISQLDPAAYTLVVALAKQARRLDGVDRIDRDAVWSAKKDALHLLWAAGLRGRRARSFAEYCAREGEGLTTFATWCALTEIHGMPWTSWPSELHDPHGAGVVAFRETHADAIDFHRWLQWLLEHQLGAAQLDARGAGMSLGIVQDLAVGVHPSGADAWGLADALAGGVSVGAPPDQFNQLGQDWSQPPWRPDRLAELGYAPFRDMVRTVLRDSGGIRVDHIIGLFRLWWIPAGGRPADGTYVRYDHEALLGILVLEAQRAGAVVIGEDLGVVEPRAREIMRERGLLGTSILWFEWAGDEPLPPEDYRELCLSSVTTHDLPPSAGYLALEHVAIREQLGLLTRSVEEEREVERASIDRVTRALRARGLLDDAEVDPDVVEDVDGVVIGLHRWLARTPSRMVAVALADLVGDRRAINQPGTSDEYPNWRIPLAGPDGVPVGLDDAMGADLAPDLFAALREHP